MNRRELLLGAVAMTAVVAGSRAMAAEHDHADMHHEHEHHHDSKLNMKLIEATSDCVLKAQICVQHCIVLLGEGDKSMAACAKSASQVEAMCAALQKLAATDAKTLPQMAKLAMEVCKDCEDECKKTDKHPECKACGEACAACYKECKKIAA